MKRARVVSLCDLTGTMVLPWAAAGYDCVCYDLQHSIRADRVEQVGSGSITYRWADVRSLTQADLGKPVMVFAFPPCTHLTNSGARDFKRKGLRLLIDALEIVERWASRRPLRRPRGREGGEVSGWQPISTAPKDGTYILLWPVARAVIRHGYAPTSAVGMARWHQPGNPERPGYWSAAGHGECNRPSHWMPLPAPPEESK